MKIKIVANQCNWKSWDRKITDLKVYFKRFDPEIVLEHSSYLDIPFLAYNNNGQYGVDPDWYNENISPRGLGFDIIMFVVNDKQWKNPNRARGWRTDNAYGPVELQVGVDEKQKVNFTYGDAYDKENGFFALATHEIMHALFMISGQVDLTHYYFDRGELEKARDSIILPENYSLPGLYRTLVYLQNILAKLTMTKTNKLLEISKQHLGIDASPRDLVHDSYGCAETMSTIIKKIVPEFPIVTGTWSLYDALNASKKFKRVYEPELGCVVLCVTGMGKTGKVKNGHVGVIHENGKIASNDSDSGKYVQNYSFNSWNAYYGVKGGYEMFYYKLVI